MWCRTRIISFLKGHPAILQCFWKSARIILKFIGFFIPIDSKSILFASFGGRNFDDSPKAIYEEICNRDFFDDWKLTWIFVEPEKHTIPRGNKLKMDSLGFFFALLRSRVWISNSGMDRGIGIHKNGIVKVETWHGTPMKKVGGDENQNALGKISTLHYKKIKLDSKTIRCAQSEYDQKIFQRIFHATKESILLSDLPRNDILLKYSEDDRVRIRKHLNIPEGKKIILYVPTYREYLVDKERNTYMVLSIDFKKWEKALKDYILLVRAHYAVNATLNLTESDFVRDVSNYPTLSDLYIISDLLISDYSSCFFDFSILNRPMFCFAYDLNEYKKKRGLYLNLEAELPCPVDETEDALLWHIITMDEKECVSKVRAFQRKYVPNPGNASKAVVDELIKRLKKYRVRSRDEGHSNIG